MSADANRAVQAELASWLDEGDEAALTRACVLAKTSAVDVDALLRWVQAYGATRQSTDLALRRLRFAIGLPVIAGLVCRTPSF